jgi:hypothetical protein
MHGIYNYIPEANHVYRVYIVAAILWLNFMVGSRVILFPLLTVLYFCISTFRSMWAGITSSA